MSIMSLLFGRPLASSEQGEQRIGVAAGVPSLGLDGLSSAAYGPEAAMALLAPLAPPGCGTWGRLSASSSCCWASSISRTARRSPPTPTAAGRTPSRRENLGVKAGLVAGAALMLDYILTVAVGISAGIGALVSAAPALQKYTLPLCLAMLAPITLLNLRGTREAGVIFALPTYVFIGSLGRDRHGRLVRAVRGGGHPAAVGAPPPLPPATAAVGLWILRAFAGGCTAMTGVEAVSNGVAAFRPRGPNAQRTLTVIVACWRCCWGASATLPGVRVSARWTRAAGYQSVMSQLVARWRARGFFTTSPSAACWWCCAVGEHQLPDFPRLCQIMAKNRYLPPVFGQLGRRLVYSSGILILVGLGGAAAGSVPGDHGPADSVVRLGAFARSPSRRRAWSCTGCGRGSKSRRRRRPTTPAGDQSAGGNGGREQPAEKPKAEAGAGKKSSGWSRKFSLALNGVGAAAAAVVLVIILVAKFTEGAWVTVIALPALLTLFVLVRRHYDFVAGQVSCDTPLEVGDNQPPVVIVPIEGWNSLTAKAVRYGMAISPSVTAVHVLATDGLLARVPSKADPSGAGGEDKAGDGKAGDQGDKNEGGKKEEPKDGQPGGEQPGGVAGAAEGDAKKHAEEIRRRWASFVEEPAARAGLPAPKLEILPSPYRRRLGVLLEFMDRVKGEHPERRITVIIPSLVETRWWQYLLHNHRAAALRMALLLRDDHRLTIVNVPWYLEDEAARVRLAEADRGNRGKAPA